MDYKYRLIDAKEYLEVETIKEFEEQVECITRQVNPKDYQCISMDGHIILYGNFDPDAIITYKTPRKIANDGIDTFPVELQEGMVKIKEELKLTKEEIKKVKSAMKLLEHKVLTLEEKLEYLHKSASTIKGKANREKEYNAFNKKYSEFNECLTSELDAFDIKTKSEIRKNLNSLDQVIGDVMNRYLQQNN